MTSVQDLISFVCREQQAAATETAMLALLSDEALESRGEAVTGLMVSEFHRGGVYLTCPANESRLRPGSRVVLRDGKSKFSGTVIDTSDRGRLLHLQVDERMRKPSVGPWTARESDVDLSAMTKKCLRKLQPGAPGWGFFQTLTGARPLSKVVEATVECRRTLEAVLEDGQLSLDASQRTVVERCLALPGVAAIQGPPGTGKTRVLAVVAECLSRMGKRILIVAPTHQAVNNALSAVKCLFGSRHVVKMGDPLRRESLCEGVVCSTPREMADTWPYSRKNVVIFGMTFMSCLAQLILRTKGLAPNVVLIDEAGQLPLSQGASAGLVGAGSILLFGDDAQMPPVFPSGVADDPLSTSLFAQIRKTQTAAVTTLETTYRMNRELCGVVQEAFYPGGRLAATAQAANRRFSLPSDGPMDELSRAVLGSGASLVWLQTPASGCQQFNPIEAVAIARLARMCLAGGMQSSQMAVVTPFRRQAALIRHELRECAGKLAVLPTIDTVERVQGLTVEVVFISLAATDLDFVVAVAGFLFQRNRMNVAISRATTKVVFACSPSILSVVPPGFESFRSKELLGRILAGAHSVQLSSTNFRAGMGAVGAKVPT